MQPMLFSAFRKMRHKLQQSRWLILFFIASLLSFSLAASPVFPKLSGQVIDKASLLDSGSKQRLEQFLAGHEQASGNQVVVVTLPNLQGLEIETFGYQLARHWGIGQKDKNNGVLLIVAKQERSIRIEVGYGLEGELTDAISSNIIHAVIRPAFKKGQFDTGIVSGANAIVEALGGEYVVKERQQSRRNNNRYLPWFVLAWIVWNLIRSQLPSEYRLSSSNRRSGMGGFSTGSGYGGGFSGGGGFGGGGGSFGGGGASGGW